METSIPSFVSSLVAGVRTRAFTTAKIAATTWPTNAPFFFHGSPLEIQSQISGLKDPFKWPAIFLIEYIEDEINLNRTRNVGAAPKLKMFFMYPYRESYTINQQYTNVIDVMDELAREFIAVCQKSRYILRLESYGTIRHSKWGIYRKDKGNLTPIFPEKLSGVELNITLEIDKVIDIQCGELDGALCPTFSELMETRSAAQIVEAIEDAGKEEDVQDLICGPVIVRNSDDSYHEEVTQGNTLTLPDTDVVVNFNGDEIQNDTVPAMTDIIINIGN